MTDETVSRRTFSPKHLALGVAVLGGLVLLCWVVFSRLHYHWNWSGIWEYRKLFISGWLLTVAISVGALIVSLALGGVLAAGSLSPNSIFRWLARGYIELVRGTPLLVQLLIGYYVVANALALNNHFIIGVLLLSSFAGAYLAEILRGGIESVAASQVEAARAVGFTPAQTYRHVVLPQAIRRVLPAMAGQFVSLIKDSSLLSVIGLEELTQQAKIANSATYSSLEGFVPLAIGYLILTLPLSWVASQLERKFRYED